MTPGWFDKSLPWRRADPRNWQRAVILSPSPSFVASLPGGKIPEVQDFYDMPDPQRIPAWRAARAASTRLGEEFGELLDTGRFANSVLCAFGTRTRTRWLGNRVKPLG